MSIIANGQVVPFITLIAFFVIVLVIREYAKRGWIPSVRTIAGLEAIEECVGRAVEMGKPVLINMGMVGYTPIGVAAMNIMAHTAEVSVRKGAEILVPISNAEIIPTVVEMLKNAFVSAGYSEGFNREEQIRYLSPLQWAFCAGVQAIMETRKPGAHIFLGHLGGSTMIVVETGARVGAIQVGGTTNTMQIPFMVAACDYSLIGEEVTTAGIYLSGESDALSQIRVVDIFKLIAIGLIVIGVILVSAGNLILPKLLAL
jgi:hypothetical protein